MIPSWLEPLVREASQVPAERFSRFLPPQDVPVRRSAVLVLFGDDQDHGPDVLLIERAAQMRSHAGQPAFPGGAMEAGDDGPVATAIREAAEETGLDPVGVEPLATLPALWVPVSGHAVTPVLAYWRQPVPVHAADPAEVASVVRAPIAHLVDPVRRVSLRHPSGHVGPAFRVGGLLVWGFTGGLLSTLLDLAGWSRPWDRGRIEPWEE